MATPNSTTIRCTQCGEEKPATREFFSPDKRKRSGLQARCKHCQNINRSVPGSPGYEKLRAAIKRCQQNPETMARRRENDRKRKLVDPDYVERKRAYKRKYKQKPKVRDKQREYLKTYFKTPIGQLKRNIDGICRRARKQGLPDTFTVQDWQYALDYFNGCCAVCGRPVGLWHTLAADHWIPLASLDCPGTIPQNIVPLCHGIDGCNNSKSNTSAEAWLEWRFGSQKARIALKRIKAFFDSVRKE